MRWFVLPPGSVDTVFSTEHDFSSKSLCVPKSVSEFKSPVFLVSLIRARSFLHVVTVFTSAAVLTQQFQDVLIPMMPMQCITAQSPYTR